jgi:hypothetical protein
MRRSSRAVRGTPAACAAALLLLAVVGAPASAAEFAPACSNAQSPRDVVAQIDGQSGRSIVEAVDAERVIYTPRDGGESRKLSRCGQHYHFPIENHQRCAGEIAAPEELGRHATMGGDDGHAGNPGPGDVVEVHTVFAARVDPNHCPSAGDCCDPESLDCCKEGPFVVRAFNATVTAGGEPGPIETPPGRPLAEWSGSTTGLDREPRECKPAAQWSFRLGCGFELTEGQLRAFHPHAARGLQTGYRVSNDLTLVTP